MSVTRLKKWPKPVKPEDQVHAVDTAVDTGAADGEPAAQAPLKKKGKK
jgi:hypothetical protein